MSKSSTDKRILTEAGEWVARRRGIALDQSRADPHFEAWLASDVRHANAYDRLCAHWEDLSALTELQNLVDPDIRPSWRDMVRAPQIALLAAGFAAIFFLSFFLNADWLPGGDRHQTAIAEIRTLQLADGSQVTLGAATSLRVRFEDHRRVARLDGGEAFFEITHDEDRPFFVIAGDATIRVVGTKFDVRRANESVSVAVLEGLVEVNRGGALSTMLRAGERTEAMPRRLFSSPPPLTTTTLTPSTPPGAWRDGWLAYDDAPLAEIVADINRYYAPGVTISRDAGALRLTGTFKAAETVKFLETVERALPVTVSRTSTGAYHVEADAS